ncbi:hypothetical protein BP6252_09535 [Coleophoma cylindrospora]|uniref:Uncharacterized protein n=1 Tax=Coleophoma cylindrospora TaxID=1849047 RepID=A0A3D8R281_9HELO|nr:hypothetical protein BP6252_09535 [Coleophoma cylindrospora]
MLSLKPPERYIHDDRRTKGQLPRDVRSIWSIPNLERDGAHPPSLAHTQDGQHIAAPEDMFQEHDGEEGRQPVGNDVEKVLHHGTEVVAAGHGGNQEDDAAGQGPDQPGDDQEMVADRLHVQAKRVDVGDDHRHDREGENGLDELAEPDHAGPVSMEDLPGQTTDTRTLVGGREHVVVSDSRHERRSQNLDEELRHEEARERPDENLEGLPVFPHIDAVVSSNRGPTWSGPDNRGAKREHVRDFRRARAHGDVLEVLCAKAGNDAEANQHDHPRVPLPLMNLFIPEHANNDGDQADNQDGHAHGQLCIADIVQNLGPGNRVHHGPPDLVRKVEKGNDLSGIPPERVARENHRSQPELWTHRGHQGRRDRADDVEEQEAEEGVPPTESEETWSKGSKSQGCLRYASVLVSGGFGLQLTVPTLADMKRENKSLGLWLVRSSEGTRSIPPSSAPEVRIHCRTLTPHEVALPASLTLPMVVS